MREGVNNMDRQDVAKIGAVWDTVKAMRRQGRGGPVDQALVGAAGALWEGVKETRKKIGKVCRIILDEQQVLMYTPFQRVDERGGETMRNFIAYYRVSTKQQGASGLGLDAQRNAVAAFAAQHGASIVKEFTEVESGKKSDRPELTAALACAKRARATLVVAKLDRLARNVHFLSGLMESGVDFLAVDNPAANKLTVHIMAAMAEYEREAISARTKAALAEAKARGVALGSARPGHWEGREEARRRGGLTGLAKAHKVVSEKARAEYADLLPSIQEMRTRGMSLRAIASALNKQGHKTRRGKDFGPSQIQKILERAE
jgi:DNA invertase Pin-like site-specific DNA recombinase